MATTHDEQGRRFLVLDVGWRLVAIPSVELPIERGASGALAPATAQLHRRHVCRYLVPFFGA